MNAPVHPPYGIPELRRIGENILWVRDRDGVFNMHVTDADKDGPPRINVTATFHESLYGPPGGIELSIYWKKGKDPYSGEWMIRVGDKETPYLGPRDHDGIDEYLDVNALGLWDIGDDLIDFIPDAIRMLGLIHQDLSASLEEVMIQASEYALDRLNADAKKKTGATDKTARRGRV